MKKKKKFGSISTETHLDYRAGQFGCVRATPVNPKWAFSLFGLMCVSCFRVGRRMQFLRTAAHTWAAAVGDINAVAAIKMNYSGTSGEPQVGRRREPKRLRIDLALREPGGHVISWVRFRPRSPALSLPFALSPS